MVGNVHIGFLKRSNQVPIDYFIEKIVNEEYDIVFTGHSLGAAVASLTTLRVLFDKRISQKIFKKNILCIGFGVPAFVDEIFKDSAEKDFKDNFHYYINKSDAVVEATQNFSVFQKNHLIKLDPILFRMIKETNMPSYSHFGRFFYIKGEGKYQITDNFQNLETSKTMIDDHRMTKYQKNLLLFATLFVIDTRLICQEKKAMILRSKSGGKKNQKVLS